jgi:hypothetical protein
VDKILHRTKLIKTTTIRKECTKRRKQILEGLSTLARNIQATSQNKLVSFINILGTNKASLRRAAEADDREMCDEAISTTTASVHMTLNMIDTLMCEQDVREKNEQAADIHRPIERFKRKRERKKKAQALTDETKSALRKASAGYSTSKMMEG